ncbi:MAG: malonyl-ACP O-methyltransferase BioC [Burkholderiales bacterium]
MAERYLVEKRAKKRAFERAAETYDAAAVLQREVARRLIERLEYVKQAPMVILDAGAGTGFASGELTARYPGSSVIALDIAHPMLRRARAGLLVCADIEQLPLKRESVGMVWSNLTLQWSNRPDFVFSEAARALQPGGLFLFSTFGPDTLKELRVAWRDADTHVNLFADMHDLGDLVVASGLVDPVMERETLTVTYSEVTDLMRDLKAIGAQNATFGRRKGLTGRAALERVQKNYEHFRRDGKLPATFEVIYAHAWKPETRLSSSGRPIIEIVPDRS